MGDGKLILENDWKKRDDSTPATPATPAAPAAGQPAIAVDADWKNQANAEKERLAAEEQKNAAAGGKGKGGKRELPEADFQTLVSTLMSQALLYMGAFPDPSTGRAVISLEYAQLHIDLLGVLEEKTKNNLTPPETEMITQVLAELRQQFVEITQALAQAVREGKIKPGAGGMMTMGGGGPAAGPKLSI